MRLGIFAKTFSETDPHAVFAQVKAAGFATAQYNMACSGLPSMPDEIPPRVATAVANEGIADEVARIGGLSAVEFTPRGLLDADKESERGPHVPDEVA